MVKLFRKYCSVFLEFCFHNMDLHLCMCTCTTANKESSNEVMIISKKGQLQLIHETIIDSVVFFVRHTNHFCCN